MPPLIESALQLTCPFCGSVDADADDYFVDGGEDERELVCAECGEEFHAVKEVRVTFSSYGYDDGRAPEDA